MRRELVWKEDLRCLILCLSGTRSSDTEVSHGTLYHGPIAAPDLSSEPTRATRSRFRFGRASPPRRPRTDPQGGRGQMEDYHLHSLVDDLGVSLADAQSGPVVPCRGQADRRVVELPGQETRQRQRRPVHQGAAATARNGAAAADEAPWSAMS